LKLKSSRVEIKGMKREVVRQTRRMRARGRMGKVEGIKRGPLPYVATFLSSTLAIMILQRTTRFPYFHFHINMLKW
jgi:hypothetical protein